MPPGIEALRDRFDASTYRALLTLMRRETIAAAHGLRSRRGFGHAIDEAELARLDARVRRLAALLGRELT